MDSQKITESLAKLFHAEGHRIVFWHDPDLEFIDLVPELALDGIETILLQNTSLLELKVKLELEDKDGKYLLYSSAPEPEAAKDWLLDIRLYSRSFHADRASILLNRVLKNSAKLAHFGHHKEVADGTWSSRRQAEHDVGQL